MANWINSTIPAGLSAGAIFYLKAFSLRAGTALVLSGVVMNVATAVRCTGFMIHYFREGSIEPGRGLTLAVFFTFFVAAAGTGKSDRFTRDGRAPVGSICSAEGRQSMSVTDLIPFMPLMILAATPIAVMLVIAFYRSYSMTVVLTGIGLAGVFISLPLTASPEIRQVTTLLIVDGFARCHIGLLVAAGFAAVRLSYGYLQTYEGHCEEYYILMLLAVLGSSVIVVSSHFASFFLGLEILSISLYALMAYPRLKAIGVEAGIKFLVVAGVSAASWLLVIVLVLTSGISVFYYLQVVVAIFARAPQAFTPAVTLPLAGRLTLGGLTVMLVGIGLLPSPLLAINRNMIA